MKLFYSFLLVVGLPVMSSAQNFVPCEAPESTSDTRVYPDLRGTCDHSYITLGPPQVSGAVATVTFYNTPVHGPHSNELYDLTWKKYSVTINFQWNMEGSPDVVEIIPPDGYFAKPQMMEVRENDTQEFHIYLIGV